MGYQDGGGKKKTKNTCRDNKEGHRPHHCNQAKTLVDET
jgi:hypothetical protein